MDRSKVSGKGFDAESRLFLVFLKFEVLNIEERRVTIQKKSWREQYRSRGSEEGSWYVKYHRFRKHQESARYRHQSQRQKDAEYSSGGSQREIPIRTGVSNTPFQTGEKKLSVKMKFFIEQGENAMNPKGIIYSTDVCSEEERKMLCMRETWIRLFMQMELDNCRNELICLIRCHNCAADTCPEEEYPPRPLPIPPDYINNLKRRLGKAMNGIIPPTLVLLKMVLKT